MIVKSIQLLHYKIPLTSEFQHAKKARSFTDTLLIVLTTRDGHIGIGEALPRSYVTGESVAAIMGQSDQSLLHSVIGLKAINQAELKQWIIAQLADPRWGLAILGGVETALWQAFAQNHTIDLTTLIGLERRSKTGNCITVGFDAELNKLRARAIHAKLNNASVVKLKIGLPNDVERLHTLNSAFKGNMSLRLDANGSYTTDDLERLLEECGDLPLHSVEQPFEAADPNLAEKLIQVYRKSGVPFMADESVCSLRDARYWISRGGYQYFNLRIGKHGGMVATCAIRDEAKSAGLKLVAGSMVGETGILSHTSRVFLHRSDSISYVEGLGQNESFLGCDPVQIFESAKLTFSRCEIRQNDCSQYLQSTVEIG